MPMKTQYTVKEAEDFQRLFGLNLKAHWDVILGRPIGFDVVKFDHSIGTPDGESCADYVLTKYGQEGLDLCNQLLGRTE